MHDGRELGDGGDVDLTRRGGLLRGHERQRAVDDGQHPVRDGVVGRGDRGAGGPDVLAHHGQGLQQ